MLDTSCTTDPTYHYFEQEQLQAYCETEEGKQLLLRLRNPVYIKQILRETDSSINDRPNSIGFEGKVINDETNRHLNSGLNEKLPTCFENPLVYIMIKNYVSKVEKARKQLKLPLKQLPKYGSLPTASVNAYSYPAEFKPGDLSARGSIIGFNTMLFMFAYQMTKVTLPTVTVSQNGHGNKILIDPSREAAIGNIDDNPDIRINFIMAILEFLRLTNPETQPLDRKYDADLLRFTTAIELFAVAHEYGHLIKGHIPVGVNKLQLSYLAPEEENKSFVEIHSWKQELEADEIGVKLLIQVLKNEIAGEKNQDLMAAAKMRHLFALKAPLFYFKAGDIIDRAKNINERGAVPSNLSKEEVVFIQNLAAGKAGFKDTLQYPNLHLKDHPPGWLRAERISKLINDYSDNGNFKDDQIAYGNIGEKIVNNLEILWNLCLPRFPYMLQALKDKKLPDSTQYIRVAGYWEHTFLYNIDLRKCISLLEDSSVSDATIYNQYAKAVKTDWLLLSGIQSLWAESMLKKYYIPHISEAISLLALSGDKRYISVLEGTDTVKLSSQQVQFLRRAIAFLTRNNRSMSIESLSETPAKDFNVYNLLAYPSGALDERTIRAILPDTIDSDIRLIFKRNGVIEKGGSLSPTALFMLLSKKDRGYIYDVLADFLLKMNYTDAAMDYAMVGVIKCPTNANLENTLGNVLTEKGDYGEANKHYTKSLQLGRNDGWPEINMAKNYVLLVDYANAEKWFEAGIKHDSTARSADEFAGYLNEYSWFLVTKYPKDTIRVNKAIAYSMVSNKIVQYSDPAFLDTLAECLAAEGLYKDAVTVSESALQLIDKEDTRYTEYKKRLDDFRSKQTKQGKSTP